MDLYHTKNDTQEFTSSKSGTTRTANKKWENTTPKCGSSTTNPDQYTTANLPYQEPPTPHH